MVQRTGSPKSRGGHKKGYGRSAWPTLETWPSSSHLPGESLPESGACLFSGTHFSLFHVLHIWDIQILDSKWYGKQIFLNILEEVKNFFSFQCHIWKLTGKILSHHNLCNELAALHDRWAPNCSVAKKPPQLLVCISSTNFQPYLISVMDKYKNIT